MHEAFEIRVDGLKVDAYATLGEARIVAAGLKRDLSQQLITVWDVENRRGEIIDTIVAPE